MVWLKRQQKNGKENGILKNQSNNLKEGRKEGKEEPN